MNEINEMELSQVSGGTITVSGLVGSFVGGGISGAIGAAVTATTIGALAIPALVGGTIALTGYLVRDAIDEGILAAEAYRMAR